MLLCCFGISAVDRVCYIRSNHSHQFQPNASDSAVCLHFPASWLWKLILFVPWIGQNYFAFSDVGPAGNFADRAKCKILCLITSIAFVCLLDHNKLVMHIWFKKCQDCKPETKVFAWKKKCLDSESLLQIWNCSYFEDSNLNLPCNFCSTLLKNIFCGVKRFANVFVVSDQISFGNSASLCSSLTLLMLFLPKQMMSNKSPQSFSLSRCMLSSLVKTTEWWNQPHCLL